MKWMKRALELAGRGVGLTSPNPSVGAVIVKDGSCLGEGWHRKAGGPHAEVEAISAATDAHGAEVVSGATIYVSLEPCSTWGKTGSCSEAIVKAGLKRVVYACQDPNPSHRGKADAHLAEHGVEVERGVLEDEAEVLLAPFARMITEGRPWVIAKSALTLDGSTTLGPGRGPWLSSGKSLALVQELRLEVDAILVGGETLRKDNPSLTVRIPHPHGDKAPLIRAIVTESGALPEESRVFHDEHQVSTQVFCQQPLQEILRSLAKKGCQRVLVESGGRLLGELLDQQLVDEMAGFLTPHLAGGDHPIANGLGVGKISEAAKLEKLSFRQVENDLMWRGTIRYHKERPRWTSKTPCVFFDRDGVVNDPGEQYYVTSWEGFRFQPGIEDVLAALKAAGFLLVLVTSQKGVGKGLMSPADLENIHQKMQNRLQAQQAEFDLICAFTGTEADPFPNKPDPQMAFAASDVLGIDLNRSWMVGDADRDIAMGKAAGLKTIRVRGDKPVTLEADHLIDQIRQISEIIL